jgi:hypothetical protein
VLKGLQVLKALRVSKVFLDQLVLKEPKVLQALKASRVR